MKNYWTIKKGKQFLINSPEIGFFLGEIPDLYESKDDAESIVQDYEDDGFLHTEDGSFSVDEFEIVKVKLQIV